MNSLYHKRLNYISAIILCLIILITSIAIDFKTEEVQTTFLEKATNDIVPKPLSYIKGDGKFILNKDSKIYINGKTKEETKEVRNIAEILKLKLSTSTGYELNIVEGEAKAPNSIYLTTIGGEESQDNEGYNLITTKDKVEIIAYKPEGISRGIQTLRQLFPAEIEKNTVVNNLEWSIPVVNIKDKPQYSYRGIMIDVARHFFSVYEIKRQIDNASLYKINKFHLHLSDDQGWRLEIKKYPELTKIGGSTEVGGGKGGYYTQEQFKDIVKYANDRYIDIVPEFDMPGHSNAALASYGFLNPDGKRRPLYTGTEVGFSSFMTNNEKTYEFLDNIFKEVAAISPSKYIHIGGDEALSTKKNDYDYFVGRVSKMVKALGKTPIGWDPIDTASEIDSSVVLQNWKDNNEAARKKQMKMIISIASKAYLDMKYNKDTPYGLDWAGYIPIETAYKWDPTDYAPKELVLGIEAPLWTETISTKDQMDYMIYPRLLGYAEIGWTPKDNRNWSEYKTRLKNQEERLTNLNINYYK